METFYLFLILFLILISPYSKKQAELEYSYFKDAHEIRLISFLDPSSKEVLCGFNAVKSIKVKNFIGKEIITELDNWDDIVIIFNTPLLLKNGKYAFSTNDLNKKIENVIKKD